MYKLMVQEQMILELLIKTKLLNNNYVSNLSKCQVKITYYLSW